MMAKMLDLGLRPLNYLPLLFPCIPHDVLDQQNTSEWRKLYRLEKHALDCLISLVFTGVGKIKVINSCMKDSMADE